MRVSSVAVLFLALSWSQIDCKDLLRDEAKAKLYVKAVNQRLAEESRKVVEASWAYETNINDQTSAAQMKAKAVFNDYQKRQLVETRKYDWTDFSEDSRRQFERLAVIGTSALAKEDEDQFEKVSNDMQTIYSSAKACVSTKGCNLELDPDLLEIMAQSKNYSELAEAWINWREVSGKPIRQKFVTYFQLGNKAAQMNELPNKKFHTLDDLWMFDWETTDIKEQVERLWQQLKPFYDKLHAYVRMKLTKLHPDQMPKDGTIPAHLLGNMWAQQWGNIMSTVQGVDPYPELAPIDVSNALKEQGYTPRKMFELAEKFFTDLGLDKMTDTFWEKSLIEKPKDRAVVCHATANDFMHGEDFRIKMCTKVNMADLVTVHHEMGHIQYYMQYKHQPTVYRNGANPGFHEAIGDLLALSVSTPKHLKKVNLLKDTEQSDLEKINIKFQLTMALNKLMFLPFSYIMDKWRWDVFSGKASIDDMNRHWWRLRGEYQGLSPPVQRSEKDFDAGAKFHVPAGIEYVRYFGAHILQFQIHKKLCSFGQKDFPLHECDIDGDKEAGLALKKMLQKGASEVWPKQLEELTGNKDMDAQPLLDYFKPLDEFLTKELSAEKTGWTFDVDEYFEK